MEKKFLKNGILGLQILIGFIFVTLSIILALIFIYNLELLISGIIFDSLILLAVLFIPDTSITYVIVLNDEGIELKNFNKSLVKISWKEIKQIKQDSLRYVQIVSKDDKIIKFLITWNRKSILKEFCKEESLKDQILKIECLM